MNILKISNWLKHECSLARKLHLTTERLASKENNSTEL